MPFGTGRSPANVSLGNGSRIKTAGYYFWYYSRYNYGRDYGNNFRYRNYCGRNYKRHRNYRRRLNYRVAQRAVQLRAAELRLVPLRVVLLLWALRAGQPLPVLPPAAKNVTDKGKTSKRQPDLWLPF